MVVLRKPPAFVGDFGGTKLSLLMEKQHNRGQDGAGAAILVASPEPGETPYWIAKSASATPLADVLGAIGKRSSHNEHMERKEGENDLCGKKQERIFIGHLRYATFGKNEVAFCHPFVHEASELEHTLLLAGNFNLTNAHELFVDYSRHGSFPTSKADGYLICELIAHELGQQASHAEGNAPSMHDSACSARPQGHIANALSAALASADGAWTLCGATGDGWAFATRDSHGIRPGFYYVSEDVVAVASERPAIQAAFDVPPEAVMELPPGKALVASPDGEVIFSNLGNQTPQTSQTSQTPQTPQTPQPSQTPPSQRSCSFERIYFSRANDADIHRERKALGAALVPQILKAADAPLEDIFFSYIPNSARIAFHGLLEELFTRVFVHKEHSVRKGEEKNPCGTCDLCGKRFPRFGEIAVKDAKFRTFIADAAARREFYKHVYDVTYGLVRPGKDTLVVLDDSIVRGNTMKNAILPMLDRLGPKRIIVASSAPPIRYPDCYGIDMSTLGELVAFRALVNLLDQGERGTGNGERESESVLREAFRQSEGLSASECSARFNNPLAALYARFSDEQHCAEIARLLTPPGMKAEVKVVYQTVENLRRCLCGQTSCGSAPNSQSSVGDWYFTGDYPTPGGYKVLRKALGNYLSKNSERSY